jgi:hypothetical protein
VLSFKIYNLCEIFKFYINSIKENKYIEQFNNNILELEKKINENNKIIKEMEYLEKYYPLIREKGIKEKYEFKNKEELVLKLEERSKQLYQDKDKFDSLKKKESATNKKVFLEQIEKELDLNNKNLIELNELYSKSIKNKNLSLKSKLNFKSMSRRNRLDPKGKRFYITLAKLDVDVDFINKTYPLKGTKEDKLSISIPDAVLAYKKITRTLLSYFL